MVDITVRVLTAEAYLKKKEQKVQPAYRGFYSDFQVCFCKPTDVQGIYQDLYDPSACRSRLQDYIYTVTKDKNYPPIYTNGLNIPLDANHTYMHFILPESHNNEKSVAKNLSRLNRIERGCGLQETVLEYTHNGFVSVSDPAWQSNLWKISILSYLLKYIAKGDFFYKGEYTWAFPPKVRKVLFSKINTEFKEKITKNEIRQAIHNDSGFVSISCRIALEKQKKDGWYNGEGENEEMTDLLFHGRWIE
jgi:hypothetical protein